MRKPFLFGTIFAFVLLGGCTTIQGWFPGVTSASVLDALDRAIHSACGAVPLVSSLEAVLKADGIMNPTEAQVTMIASQVCKVLIPPKAMTSRTAGSSDAPVILGYLHGAPIYGYWAK